MVRLVPDKVLFTIDFFRSKDAMDQADPVFDPVEYFDGHMSMSYRPGRSYLFLDGDEIMSMVDGLVYHTGFTRFHTMDYFIELVGTLGENLFVLDGHGNRALYCNWQRIFRPLDEFGLLHFSKILLPCSSTPLAHRPFYRSILRSVRFAKFAASKEEVKYSDEWFDLLYSFRSVKVYLLAFLKRHSTHFL